MTYLVTVRGSNVSGTSVRIFTVSVTEGPPVPTLKSTSTYTLPILLNNTPTTLDLAQYFNNGTTYALLVNPQSSASITGSTLTVTGNYRDTVYTLSISATNISGTSAVRLSVQVTESPPIPLCSAPSTPLTLTATTMTRLTLNVASYFTSYTSYPTSFAIVSNPNASATISGSTLTVFGKLRNTTYIVTVSGSNITGTSVATLPVTITESSVVLERMPVDMSSNTFTAADGTYTSSASSVWNSSTTPAYGVFNQLLQTDPFAGKWVSAASKYDPTTYNALSNPALDDGAVLGFNGEWLQIKMPMYVFPVTYQIAGDMYGYRVYASNTSGQWALLDTQVRGESYSARSTYSLKSSSTTTAYRTFLFKITKSRMDTGSGRAAMMWFNIFGIRAEGLNDTPPLPTMLGSTTVTLPILTTTTPSTVDLSLYFSFASGYTIVTNPVSSGSISGSTLTVTGARRNTSYTVTVRGTNVNGTSANVLSVSVSESA